MFIRALNYLKQRSLVISFLVFSLIPLFYLANSFYVRQVEQKQIGNITQQERGFPVRLRIPAINVNTTIQRVGINSRGEMEVPGNVVDVGWFKLGSIPGERGSAVIDGHFDGGDGKAGVFINLYKLKPGDKLYVEDSRGKTTVFIVRESKTFDPGLADGVFSRNDGTYLNLITCDGVWDGVKKSYNKRLVVFADVVD